MELVSECRLKVSPGESVVMARRHGVRWYVAGINGTDDVQTLSIPADRLPSALRVTAAYFIMFCLTPAPIYSTMLTRRPSLFKAIPSTTPTTGQAIIVARASQVFEKRLILFAEKLCAFGKKR